MNENKAKQIKQYCMGMHASNPMHMSCAQSMHTSYEHSQHKTKGWSGDSFDRYNEYRYCLAVNVIGFVYSGFQAFDMAYYLSKGKHIFVHHLRHHFDFAMDQILAYLIMSASSSAATRVDDWISNWGGRRVHNDG